MTEESAPFGADSAVSIPSVLLVPAGAVNPRMGGGQRTALFFEALKSLGPVTVVLAGMEDTEAAVFFPGAEAVVPVSNDALSTRPRSQIEKLLRSLRRISGAGLARDAGLAESVSAIIDYRAPRIVLTRYALLFARAERKRRAGMLEVLDVDDRDDLKARSQLAHYLGDPIRPLTGLLTVGIRQRLKIVLGRADMICFAKPADVMDLDGIETLLAQNVPFAVPDAESLTPASVGRDVLFVGTFGHDPNRVGMQWFLDHVWPDIATKAPETRLRVVGLGDWSSLASDYCHLPNIDFVGTVDDLAPEYARARVVICPVPVVAGSQIKLIEACAYGRPVVATTGAAGGFGEAVLAAVWTADTPAAFIRACRAFLDDPELATKTGCRLRRLQETEASRSALEARIRDTLLARLSAGG